jgi:hypothetical protein
MADIFKDIVPSILQTKSPVLDNEKDYVPFVVNRALSFHYDCVLQVNMMNRYPTLDEKLQYDFYLNSIRSYKRPFQKWLKRETISDIELVREYYNCSTEKAKETLTVLTKDQLNTIRKKLFKGGLDDKHKSIDRGSVK